MFLPATAAYLERQSVPVDVSPPCLTPHLLLGGLLTPPYVRGVTRALHYLPPAAGGHRLAMRLRLPSPRSSCVFTHARSHHTRTLLPHTASAPHTCYTTRAPAASPPHRCLRHHVMILVAMPRRYSTTSWLGGVLPLPPHCTYKSVTKQWLGYSMKPSPQIPLPTTGVVMTMKLPRYRENRRRCGRRRGPSLPGKWRGGGDGNDGGNTTMASIDLLRRTMTMPTMAAASVSDMGSLPIGRPTTTATRR